MPTGRRQRRRLKLGALATTVVFVSAIDMGFCQVVKMAITLTHSCLALYCHWRGPAAEVHWYKYGNYNSMGLASCGWMWSVSRAPLHYQRTMKLM